MIQDTSKQDRRIAPRPKPWLKIFILVALAAVLLVWLGTTLSQIYQSDYTIRRERLTIDRVSVEDLEKDIVVQGRVVAANSPTLYAPAEGVITFHVNAGDRVEKGKLLATVESPELANDLMQARSELKKLRVAHSREEIQGKRRRMENQQAVEMAQVGVTAAEREMQRAERSIVNHLISELDFETAQDDLAKAKLELTQAIRKRQLETEFLAFELDTKKLEVGQQQLVVDELERRLETLLVRSPVSGLIGSLAVNQKAAVRHHQSLLTVVDLSSFEVEVKVPENYADDLGIAMPVVLQFGNKQSEGSVKAISPEVIDNEVVARITFSDQLPSSLKKGMRQNQRLSARIVLEKRSAALTLPRGSYLDASGGNAVWKVDGNLAIKTPIRLGSVGLRKVEIIDGLQAGDQVITSNTDAFKRATKVMLVN